MSIPWYLCHVSKAIWLINGVYRYWLWIPLTPFYYISCNIKLTNTLYNCYKKRSVAYWRAYPFNYRLQLSLMAKVNQSSPLSNPFKMPVSDQWVTQGIWKGGEQQIHIPSWQIFQVWILHYGLTSNVL